jgi:transposase
MRAKPWEVPDGLWERIEPLLPRKPRRFRYPGRKPFDDRRALQGILFVLHTGIGWEHLPQELGFGCGLTAWRRLRAAKTGPSPVDRGRAGSKHHLLVDGGGVPLAWTLTGGNRHDVTQLIDLLDRVPPVRGRFGRPRRRPATLIADRGYDHDKYRRLVWRRGIKPVIARRQTGHGSGLGPHRWVVERTFAWLHNRRRLLVRTDRRDDIHESFLALACCLICWRQLETS